MTPEREKEIRNFVAYRDLGQTGGPFEPVFYKELLEEIDKLRAELDDARNTRLAIKLVRAEEERDQLKAENDRLKEPVL
jgi:hypothetical protein